VRRAFVSLLALSLATFVFAPSVSAMVNTSWDWESSEGKPKRELNYCAGRAVDYVDDGGSVEVETLKGGVAPPHATALNGVIALINEAGTGWSLSPVEVEFPGCQVLYVMLDLDDIHEGSISVPTDKNGDGFVELVTVFLDSSFSELVWESITKETLHALRVDFEQSAVVGVPPSGISDDVISELTESYSAATTVGSVLLRDEAVVTLESTVFFGWAIPYPGSTPEVQDQIAIAYNIVLPEGLSVPVEVAVPAEKSDNGSVVKLFKFS